jgi:hypothetical protein
MIDQNPIAPHFWAEPHRFNTTGTANIHLPPGHVLNPAVDNQVYPLTKRMQSWRRTNLKLDAATGRPDVKAAQQQQQLQ